MQADNNLFLFISIKSFNLDDYQGDLVALTEKQSKLDEQRRDGVKKTKNNACDNMLPTKNWRDNLFGDATHSIINIKEDLFVWMLKKKQPIS